MSIILFLLFVSGAEAETMALGLSLPPLVDILPPPDPAVECTPGMTVFAPDPVPLMFDREITYKDEENVYQRWILRQGILVSECGFVEILNTQVEHDRMKVELRSLKTLMDMRQRFWSDAESQYQQRVLDLEEERAAALTPDFWDEWKAPIMFAAGVLTAGVTLICAAELLRAQSGLNP